MERGYDYKKYAVLLVDDEQQALKYFDKAFAKEFRVMTAPSAEQALNIVEKSGQDIGVVITDQRMPGQTGVDLLGQVRQLQPSIVRIITTAYSDLDSAIEAVNLGGVFRYITKPWDIRELRGVLLRAMEFFLVQHERDILLREKLSVLQRMIILDRVRSFTVMAASLAFRVRHSMAALKAFFDYVPVNLTEQMSDASVNWGDLWTLAQKESQRIVGAVDEIVQTTVDADYRFSDAIAIGDVVKHHMQRLSSDLSQRGISIDADMAADIPIMRGDTRMIERLVDILLSRVTALAGDGHRVSVRISPEQSVYGAPGVRVVFAGSGGQWSTEQIGTLFSFLSPAYPPPGEMGMDVLSAFFIAHHHGGGLILHPSSPRGPGFELLLPCDPEATQEPPMESDWLDRLFTNLEGW